MKNKKTENKESSPNNNNGRYLTAGIITAIILAAIFYFFNGETDDNDKKNPNNKIHIWSPGADSLFVKNCYDKYKPQIKDDFEKQEMMKTFCRCMLEKVKSKYDENDLNKVTDTEIKAWDTECREGIFTPPHK